jgi:hypothetical protein
MDMTMVYVMMVVVALFMAILPLGVFMGLAQALEVASTDTRLLVSYILVALIFSYVLSLGAFALIQQQNCKKVNIKQAASNAGISLGIQSVVLLLVHFLPFLRNIVSDLLPAETDLAIKDSIGYSYFSAWAALFGVAIGGTLSGVC